MIEPRLAMAGDDEALLWQLLAAYEACDTEYAVWKVMTGLDPLIVEEVFEHVHEAYATLWRSMGDEFHVRLWPLARQWRSRAREARAELAGRDSLARA